MVIEWYHGIKVHVITEFNCQIFNSLNSFDSQHPFIMDQYEHSTSLDQKGLDESTVMAFHHDPDCMFNLFSNC